MQPQMLKKTVSWKVNKTYPSSSLLIWSQNPMMYSHSSCLFDGLVALSNEKNQTNITIFEYNELNITYFLLLFC